MKTTATPIARLAAFFAGAMLFAAHAAFADVSVQNVTATQRYPWNGLVDIDYEVVCDDPAADVWVYATGFDKDANVSMGVRAISGDGANAPVKPGQHRMTWDVTSDYPGFNSTAFTVKMTALVGGAPYMVVDLSGGVDAISYPVSYLSSVPAGGWTDEYKTTKLVLRLIPPGTFMMGSPSDELGREARGYKETQHQVTLTKPFYVGVFELTQRQWLNVMGTSKAHKMAGDTIPANNVSYNEIRGTVNGAAWPVHNQVDANSFMGRLRSKANMMFDLPTEAQWEYACRAGTSTALNSGKNITATGRNECKNLNEIAWYGTRANSGSCPTTVGNYLANGWGLYDMLGNVLEWCLDWQSNDLGSNAQTDPKGASSANERILRGGGQWYYYYTWSDSSPWGAPEFCRSAARIGNYPSNGCYSGGYQYEGYGFRVVCLPAD